MKLLKTKLNGLKFWYREDDKFIGQRIALGKYEEYESKLMLNQAIRLAKLAHGTAVAVDVGANIGYYTLLLAKVCKRVYAFEPDKECFGILKKNVEENNLENVILFNKAVGDKSGRVGIIKDEYNFGNSKVGQGNEIDCVSLDDTIKESIDLIKIDVQGYEEKVIDGAKNIINKNCPIIFMEHNGGNLDFLKNIYKNIWSIDYWFYTCRRGVNIDRKTGYVDLWLKKEMSMSDYWWTIKEIRIKKILKAIMGYVTN